MPSVSRGLRALTEPTWVRTFSEQVRGVSDKRHQRVLQPDEPRPSIGPVGPAHHDGNEHLPKPDDKNMTVHSFRHSRHAHWLPESTARWSPWGSGHERTETTEVYVHGDQADHRRRCARDCRPLSRGTRWRELELLIDAENLRWPPLPGFRQSRTSS